MIKQLPLLPLMEQFIRDSKSGKRRKPNGERLLPRSVENYFYVLKLLRAFESDRHTTLRITTNIRNNRRLILAEKQYWKTFYRDFTDYLLYQRGYYDNFTGTVFKTIKCFFRYLKNDRYLLIQDCYETFYVRKEDIRVIALLPEQYCFWIMDKDFEASLTPALRRSKDRFVFGCTAAMRYSDLQRLQVRNVEQRCGQHFLTYHSLKTDTPVQVKLPPFAVDIYQRYARNKRPAARLFPPLSGAIFDDHLKTLGAVSGWKEPIGKQRTRNGIRLEVKTPTHRLYRFCDQLSSHLMRKTGITVLLMLGLPEYLVRRVSGHSAHSVEFYRYINFAQSFVTDELDKAHQKLVSLYSL